MINDYKKFIPLLTRILIVILIVLGIYFVSTTVVFYILPFLLGWVIASIIEPIILFLNLRLKISRNRSAMIAILLFVVLIGSVFGIMGGIIVLQLTKLSLMLPEYSRSLYLHSSHLLEDMEDLYIQLPPDIANSIVNSLNGLLENLTSFIGKMISSLLSIISLIPGFFVFLIVTLVSSFFMARDKRKILKFIAKQMPTKTLSTGRVLKHNLLSALMGYIKAQLILMSITFVESAIGLTLIGIDYSVLVALVASVIDALPILGTGAIYIPLILWNLLLGSYQRAVYIGILYGIIILVRQILEPKILGSQIGLYPLVTLMAMYIGLKIFGIIGLIIGPISIIVLITLQKTDILPKWKE